MVVEATWEREIFHAQNYFAANPEAESVCVIGLDEVGRGAIAGPVMVGAFALTLYADGTLQDLPSGIRDSKLLTEKRRSALFAELSGDEYSYSLGISSAAEIDVLGISPALTLAAQRAYSELIKQELPTVAAVILDGNFDYFTRKIISEAIDFPQVQVPEVVEVLIKADQNCISVASASILAKVSRDELMTELSQQAPEYGWAKNKGYGGSAHKNAIAEFGVHEQHRKSWNLGVENNPKPDTQLNFDDLLGI